MLGEFEYLILAAAAQLGSTAYGAGIRHRIQTLIGRTCSLGALYTTLDRLEEKQFLTSSMSEPKPERGGRARRIIQVTAAGLGAAETFYRVVLAVSADAPWAVSPALESRPAPSEGRQDQLS